VADAQRHGVLVRRPHVNLSGAEAQLEVDDQDATVVRLGLASVHSIGETLAGVIAAGAPWESLEDLVRRGGCRQHHLEALAAAGALDGFASSRRDLVWVARCRRPSDARPFAGGGDRYASTDAAGVSEMERVADDLWAMGLTPEATALALVRERLDARGITRAGSLAHVESGRATVAGVVTHRQHPETARGPSSQPRRRDRTRQRRLLQGAWARWREVARHEPALVVRGTIERGQGTLALVAEAVEALVVEAPAPASRDFR
jgi:error-prone DNA polymerase